MTVKELITRLLEEDMNAEVQVQTRDRNIKGDVVFAIDNVEHWGGYPYLNFTDWRYKDGNDDSQ